MLKFPNFQLCSSSLCSWPLAHCLVCSMSAPIQQTCMRLRDRHSSLNVCSRARGLQSLRGCGCNHRSEGLKCNLAHRMQSRGWGLSQAILPGWSCRHPPNVDGNHPPNVDGKSWVPRNNEFFKQDILPVTESCMLVYPVQICWLPGACC
jgi:hypothetical protein